MRIGSQEQLTKSRGIMDRSFLFEISVRHFRQLGLPVYSLVVLLIQRFPLQRSHIEGLS